MQSMQSKVLAEIARMADETDLDTSIQENYSNTGTVFFHKKRAITPFGSVYYSFQPDHYTLRIKWFGKDIPSQEGRDDYFDFYQPYDQTTRFWLTFADLLYGLKQKNHAKPAA